MSQSPLTQPASPEPPVSETGAVDPLGAGSTSERVEMIQLLTDDLSELLETETALIEAHQSSRLRETEEKKARLSGLYAREMRAISARPELLQGISATQKQGLHSAASTFDTILHKHARALSRSRAVTEGLVRAIGDEVARLRQPVTSYARPGRQPKTPMNHTAPAALSLDQSI